MILTIDIGNSNITIALFNGDVLCQSRLVSELNKKEEPYSFDFIEFFLNNNYSYDDLEAIVICSVVPNLTKIIKNSLKLFSKSPIFVVGEGNFEVKMPVSLKNKAEIGADRLVNAHYAYKKFGDDLVIVDFGTATTFDIVGNGGSYLGGVICPGVNLSIQALHNMTAKLPNINVKYQENVIGKSTKEAMNSGIYFGYISLVEGLITKIKKEYGKKMQVIATGGLSVLFNDGIDQIDFVEEKLTLEGLNLVYRDFRYC